MQTFAFVYGVRCEVQADSREVGLQKMMALQQEEKCPCNENDCSCIHEGNIGIWDEAAIGNGIEF